MSELSLIVLQLKKFIIQNEFRKAEFLINKSFKEHPQNCDLLYFRACIYRKKRRFDEALLDLETAYKYISLDDPLEAEIRNQIALTYNEMGVSLFESNHFSEANSIFTEALKFKENDWGILVNKGDSNLKLNDLKEALKDFLKAYEKAQDKSEIRVRIAHVYFRMGTEAFNKRELDQSLEFFDKSIEYRPNASEYYLFRGKCYYEKKRLKKALEDFSKALELNQNNQEAKNLLGIIKKNVLPYKI